MTAAQVVWDVALLRKEALKTAVCGECRIDLELLVGVIDQLEAERDVAREEGRRAGLEQAASWLEKAEYGNSLAPKCIREMAASPSTPSTATKR